MESNEKPDGKPARLKPHRRHQLLDHFNSVDLKSFARCWVALWVSMLLIYIQPTLDHIGLATFLGSIILFIVPPAGTVLIYLLAALTLLLGMCLAWAWGLLSMKAAFAARPDSETNAKYAELQQQAVANANRTGQSPQWEGQILVYEGFMLDTRVTVIFYVFGCVFIYALARLRCANPKFTLTQIFGTIVTDLFMEFGPPLPSFVADVAAVLVKPSAIGIGVGAACCVLIFPQSTSSMVLGLMEKVTRMSETALETTQRRLNNDEVPIIEAKAFRARLIAALRAGQPHLAFLPLDFARGLWNAEDILELQHRLRKLVFASLYLVDFHIGRINAAEMLKERMEENSETDGSQGGKLGIYQIGQHHRQEATNLLLALQRPDLNTIREETQKAMRDCTEDVLSISRDAIQLAANCIRIANSCRWFRKPKPGQLDELVGRLEAMRDKLQVAREESVKMAASRVMEVHAELFDEKGMLKMKEQNQNPLLSSLVIAMVLEERITESAAAIEGILDHLRQLCSTRRVARFWFPLRLRYAFSWVRSGQPPVPGSSAANDATQGIDTDPDDLFAHTEEVRRRLEVSRVARGTAARRSKLVRGLGATYKWLTNGAGLYALRMVIVTVALTIPSTLASTSGFFYREKGIWAVISAQTVLLVYMSEFTFSLISRTLGTVLGGAIGMVAWYIGAGTGPGNPYGMAAVTGAVLVPLIWLRLFLPPAFAMANIMLCTTFALVIGFSWDDEHIVQYGLPGKGYEAFWKRVVTVLIGFMAAFVVQIFPRPPSATRHTCKTLARSVRTLSDHYALLVSHWGRSDENSEALGAVSGQITLEVAEVLLALDPTIANLKMEWTSSPFSQKTLKQAQEQCQYINQALGGLLFQASVLPIELQERLVRTMGIKDNRGIGDIMAVLGIIEQAFMTGSPLPERLPAPLVGRAVEKYMNVEKNGARSYDRPIGDQHHRRYCVAVTLYLKFLTSVDDLLLVLKSALGERHIVYEWEEEA